MTFDAQAQVRAAARAKRWAKDVRADSHTMPDARDLVASVLSKSGIDAVTIVAGFLMERDDKARGVAQAAEFEARRMERQTMARQLQNAAAKIGDESPAR